MSSKAIFVSFLVLSTIALACYLLLPAPSTESHLANADPSGAVPALPAPAPALVNSNVLRAGFNFTKAPYVLPAQFSEIDPEDPNHPPLGFEVDIFQTALKRAGYTFMPTFQTLLRIEAELGEGNLDAAELAGAPQPGIFYSQPISYCKNFAITRKRSNLTIESIHDLRPLTFSAWQGAATVLGPAFAAVTRDNPNYHEHIDQEAQYLMFIDGKVDAVIIDELIFAWWHAQHRKKNGPPEDFDYHPIFPGVNPYYMGFRNKSVRDAFDEQLTQMLAAGEVDALMARYIPTHTPRFAPGTRTIPVIFGIARPPFVMEQERRGLSIDLAYEAFRRMGLLVRPSFAPNQRMESELASGEVEIAVEVRQFSPDFYYSEPFTTYHNVVATRKNDDIAFERWNDLGGHRVAGWQMAQNTIGPEFDGAREGFGQYTEFPDQREQVLQWATGHFDAILIDQSILAWHLTQLAREFKDIPALAAVRMDPFPENTALDFFVGFRDETLCEDFNRAHREMIQDGTVERIRLGYQL